MQYDVLWSTLNSFSQPLLHSFWFLYILVIRRPEQDCISFPAMAYAVAFLMSLVNSYSSYKAQF